VTCNTFEECSFTWPHTHTHTHRYTHTHTQIDDAGKKLNDRQHSIRNLLLLDNKHTHTHTHTHTHIDNAGKRLSDRQHIITNVLRSCNRADLKYLNLQIGLKICESPDYTGFPHNQGTQVCSRENFFEILGTPVKICSSYGASHGNLRGNFGSRICLKFDLFRLWFTWDTHTHTHRYTHTHTQATHAP